MIRKISILAMMFVSSLTAFSQDIISCDTNIVAGQNLVVNGGFEDGDVGFSIPGFKSWNKGENPNSHSVEGEYYVHDNAKDFNNAFTGAPFEGDKFLLIDGECDPNSIVWEQKINIAKNTRYYFEAHISSIYHISTAILSFEIDGEILPDSIVAPETVGQWVSFVDSSWFSGEKEGEVTIRIRNKQNINCGDGNDFALDNISLTAGCFFGADGEIPDLGADLSLCGTDGQITLEPNVPAGNIYKYRWNNTDTTSSITIDKPGTYSVCMTTNGSCIKSDIIKISEDFQITLDGDKAICKEVKDTLTIDHVGPLVSYKWFQDGIELIGEINDTLIPTEAGTYQVEVTDAAANCGTKTDNMTLSVGSFTVDLGDDQELCKPGNVILEADYDGMNYAWFLDNQRLGQFNTKSIEVNQPGTYKVIVSDPICPSVEATVNVTTSTFKAVNNTFCLDTGSDVLLKIENTTSTPNSYIWYSDEAMTNQVATGTSYTAPTGLLETTTYYVKDTSVFQNTVGPEVKTTNSGFGNTGNQLGMSVEITQTVIIDSIMVYPLSWNVGNMDVGITFRNVNTNVLIADTIVSIPVENWGGVSPNGIYVPFNLKVPAGSYIVNADGTNGNGIFYTQNNPSPAWPYTDTDGIITLDQILPDYHTNQIYSGFYDWHFSTGVVCDAVQVQAVYDPLLCFTCESPTLLTIAKNGQLNCPGDIITLTATITGGTGNWTYVWSKDNVELAGNNSNTLSVDYTESGTYSVRVFDVESPDFCKQESTDMPLIISTPSPSVTIASINAGTWCQGDDNGFEVTDSTSGGNSPVYNWYLNGVLQTETTNTFINNAFINKDSVAVVMIPSAPNAACPSDTDHVVLQDIQVPDTVSISLVDSSICAGDIFTASSISENEGVNPTYVYEVNNVVVDATNGLTNLNDGDKVKITLTSSKSCVVNSKASDSITIHTVDYPNAIISPDYIELFNFEETTLDASTSDNAGTTGLWSSDDAVLNADLTNVTNNTLTFTPNELKTKFYYTLSKSEEGATCSSTDTALVIVNIEINVPNAFSPNGDGINDEFEIDKLSSLGEFDFKVYNKWGNIIFESSSANDPFWDGSRNGKAMPVGTYYYTFEYTINGTEYSQNDYIALVR